MKNITRDGDENTYYLYKGTLVTRNRCTGYYVAHTLNGRLMADTHKGMKRLINEEIRRTQAGRARQS